MSVLTGYSQLANGTSLDTLAQLAAIPASERSDGMALVVRRDGSNGQPYWYHYKGDATPVNESPYKIAPTDNMGCWFRGVPQVLTLAVANTLYAAINHTHSEYETAGTAAASMAAHLAQSDPHTQYLTQAESDALYAAINHAHSVFSSSDNGFVPASSGNSGKFLRGDGTWQDAAGGLAFGQIANSGGTVQFSAGSVNDVLRLGVTGSASIAFDSTNKLITIGATGTTYSAGTGLSLAGTTFSVVGGVLDGSSISVTAVDTTPTSLGPATLIQWFGGVTNRIKAITGTTNWWDAPATTLNTTATHLINTSNPHSVTAVQVGAEPAITTLPTTKGGTGLSSIAADNILYSSASNTLAATAISAFGRSLIDDVNAAAALTTLGAEPVITTLGITKGGTGLSSIAAGNILYTSGANTLTTSVITTFGRSLIDDADAATARTTLGAEPTITTLPVTKGGTGLGTIAAGNILYTSASNILTATVLSEFIRGFLDDANAATARATLGANDAANLTAGILAAARLPLADATTRGALEIFSTGTWTPVIKGSTTAGTHTYSNQKGNSLKLNTFCIAPFYVSISSKDAAMAGNTLLGGLPFTAKNEANFFQTIVLCQFSNVTFSAGYTSLGVRIDPNSTDAIFLQSGSGVAANVITAANVANVLLVGCAFYVTN